MKEYFDNSETLNHDELDKIVNTHIELYISKLLKQSISLIKTYNGSEGSTAEYDIDYTPFMIFTGYVNSNHDDVVLDLAMDLDEQDFNSDEEFIEAFRKHFEKIFDDYTSYYTEVITLKAYSCSNYKISMDDFATIMYAFDYIDYAIDDRECDRKTFIKFCAEKSLIQRAGNNNLANELLDYI